MGTRADFYVGRGKSAEWVGSVAFDGYPDGFETQGLMTATNEQAFRDAVAAEIAGRGDGTSPEQGWPWPWDNSFTTDYAYAFDGGKVYGTYGDHWFDADEAAVGGCEIQEVAADDVKVDFPDMSDRKDVTFGERSGLFVIQKGS